MFLDIKSERVKTLHYGLPFGREFEKWSEYFCGRLHVANQCKNDIMFPTRLEHLLLFGCLFQIYISHGVTSTFPRVEKSKRISDFGENKKYMKLHGINESTTHELENQAVMSSGHGGKKHHTMTLTHRSVFEKLSRGEIIHAGFYNRRLKQGLRRRQVS